MNRNIAFVLLLVFAVCTAYRIIPYEMRPEWLGAPQLALAIFAGSVIKDKKWAFAIPLFSLFASDLVLQLLHNANPSFAPGFYKGMMLNYLLIVGTTVIGFFINSRNAGQIIGGAIAAPVVYFLLSNLTVWMGGGGWFRPKTMQGLAQTYVDGLPFFKTSLIGTLLFAGSFFGLNALLRPHAKAGLAS